MRQLRKAHWKNRQLLPKKVSNVLQYHRIVVVWWCRVVESQVKYPTPTFQKFPTSTPDCKLSEISDSLTLREWSLVVKTNQWKSWCTARNLCFNKSFKTTCTVAIFPLVLRWMCDSSRTGCPRRLTPRCMWGEQAIIEWSWHVISIVACCHSVKP